MGNGLRRIRKRAWKALAKRAARDPEIVKAVDFLLSTMRDCGVVPTALNVLAHLVDQGEPEDKAALYAEIVEQRLRATRSS